MKKENKGAISIFALLSMLFFLIFIVVAYNNVSQKAKIQVLTEKVLIDTYKGIYTAAEVRNYENGGDIVNLTELRSKLKTREQLLLTMRSTSYDQKVNGATIHGSEYIYSSGKYYKLEKQEYQQIEYIQSHGKEYINTGIAGNNNKLSFEVKYEFTAIPASGKYAYILCSFTGENYNSTRLLQYQSNTTYFNINSKASGGSGSYTTTRTVGTVYTEKLYPTSTSAFRLDSNGTLSSTKSRTNGSSNTKNIYVFAGNTGGSPASIKLYYLKIYNDGVLVRDFVPCYKKPAKTTDPKVYGLFDLVDCIFYSDISGASSSSTELGGKQPLQPDVLNEIN